MKQMEFADALVAPADGDATDNEPIHDADIGEKLPRNAVVAISHQNDFKSDADCVAGSNRRAMLSASQRRRNFGGESG